MFFCNQKLYTYDYKKSLNNYKNDTRNRSVNYISTIDTTNQSKKKYKRSYSQTSGLSSLKKNINLKLNDSNNKPILKSFIQNKEN